MPASQQPIHPGHKLPNTHPPKLTAQKPPDHNAPQPIEQRFAVQHQSYTRSVPTKRRRHAITETPPVEAALKELRRELGADHVELGELVILGAAAKLALIHAERDSDASLRRLAERIRSRSLPVDGHAADRVRRSGWART